MAEVKPPLPALLFCGALTAFADAFDRARRRLSETFGPIQAESETWPFTHTDYYAGQMGAPLRRLFLAFERPVAQDFLAEAKIATNALEAELAREGRFPVRRPLNLDPGLILPSRLILASCKDHAHRVYLGRGIYAEVTLLWRGGEWQPLPWTYPDFREARCHAFFADLRRRHLERLRGRSRSV